MRLAVARFAVAVAVLLAAPGSPEAQPAKVVRVGLLGLRELGWVEGQNITFEDCSTVNNHSRLPDIAAELVRLKVDVIVTAGTTPHPRCQKGNGDDTGRHGSGVE